MRKYPCGAEIEGNGVHFRVWAPKCQSVDLVLEDKSLPLEAEKNGYFSTRIENLPMNALYRFCLDKKKPYFPDPASRFQPEGPHGPSQVVDPTLFQWKDSEWKGIVNKEQVILYEMHVGTFTPEGTWSAAANKLQFLSELGINVIEMMPVAEFPGSFNWGYDGVNLFAPSHHYGHPDALRAFIDKAHALGIGVILDVVYNHFGPDGNYLAEFSEDYLKTEETEWGKGINFDGCNSQHVRDYFLANAGYWIEEFHFDGLRMDACHAIIDTSKTHILAEIREQIQQKAGSRATFVIAENEQQYMKLALPRSAGGYGLDAIWNEDFHHTAMVRLTGRNEAYYKDYSGSPQEFISSVKYGFLYQGQWYAHQKKTRGSPALDVPPSRFVNFLQNHDQVANSGGSLRIGHFSNPGALRAMTTLLLLSPQIPLLFQGQEFGATTPFYYFCEMESALAKKVYQGRLLFLSQFRSFTNPDVQKKIPLPQDKETFLASKLKWEEKNKFSFMYKLHQDLIFLRKHDPVFSLMGKNRIDGAVLSNDVFCLRYRGENEERVLLVNFGKDFHLNPCPDPLLAPPENCFWATLWSSEKADYGGFGSLKIPFHGNWTISGYSALILYSKELAEHGK